MHCRECDRINYCEFYKINKKLRGAGGYLEERNFNSWRYDDMSNSGDTRHIHEGVYYDDGIHSFLMELERKLSDTENILGKEYCVNNCRIFYDRRYNLCRIYNRLFNTTYETIKERKENEEFIIELAEHNNFISKSKYANTYLFFTVIDGIRNGTLKKENHSDMGYHIHLLIKKDRTNIIFLFDKEEKNANTLYWEFHNEKSKQREEPDMYGKKRKQKIYAACLSIIKSIGKQNFRDLSQKSQVLYPV